MKAIKPMAIPAALPGGKGFSSSFGPDVGAAVGLVDVVSTSEATELAAAVVNPSATSACVNAPSVMAVFKLVFKAAGSALFTATADEMTISAASIALLPPEDLISVMMKLSIEISAFIALMELFL